MEKNEASKSLQETIKELKNENNDTHENLRRVELELEEMKSRQSCNEDLRRFGRSTF